MITVSALIALNRPDQLRSHLNLALENGVTRSEISEEITHLALVVAHPNGCVKEQVASLYAQRLAENGYITITADAAYQGGSGGTPRYVD